MAQNGTDQKADQPDGAQGRNANFAQRSDTVLKTLEDRLDELRNVAMSVSVMNKSITALRTELDEIKAQIAARQNKGGGWNSRRMTSR